jgi:PCFT/HCP family folate transporter-like MFS transporter 1/3
VFVSVGVPVGMALSGVLYKEIGFYGVFTTTAVLYAFSFCYGFFRIKEAPRQKTDQEKKRIEALKLQRCGFVRDLFDIRHISETFKVAFKEGKNNRKKRVIMLMIACMVIIGPMHGKSSSSWLPVYRSKLNYHYTLVY